MSCFLKNKQVTKLRRLSRWRGGFRIWGECLRSVIPPANVSGTETAKNVIGEQQVFEQKEYEA